MTGVAGIRCLVTGAGGFIGSHLVERLVSEGARVRAFVHYNALGTGGWLDEVGPLENVEVFPGDVTDRDSVRSACKEIDVVFHLAALIGIPYSYAAPVSYVRTNIEGTLNVLTAAQEMGVRRVVHTSTSEVYGTARQVPMDERHPLQAQSPYAATKIGGDKLVESFHLSFGVPAVTVRPFNTFGPRQSSRAVIPTIITQALAGETVRLGNLGPTRDMNYVTNTVEGFVLAAGADGAVGRTINLGTGRETSVLDLVELIGQILGRELSVVTEDSRKRVAGSEVERLIADASTAKTVLGWQPRVSLEEGLSETISWIKANRNRYRTTTYVT
jgi:NAD dependent epimerase/dehydratase